MKIEDNFIIVRSLPYFYAKEKRGVKPNTVRLLTEEEMSQIRYRKPHKIRVGLTTDSGKSFFERTIMDLTVLGSFLGLTLVDISWQHAEKRSAEEVE